MLTPAPAELTRLMAEAAEGSSSALDRLLDAIYHELHHLARSLMKGERADHTLQPTALVHEAFLRLFGDSPPPFDNRAHFFGAAAEAMRRILIDHARRHVALKRGGGAKASTLDAQLASPIDGRADELLAVDEMLRQLEKLDARKAQIVKLRFYANLSVDEISAVLDVSPITVKRDWRYARAWLSSRLIDSGES